VRLVTKDYVQKGGIDFETMPIAKISTIRTVLTLVAHFGWEIHQLDEKCFFEQVD
jgi:hypothetical protein